MSPRKTARVYLGACLLRVLNVFLIQSQFDPDEYWQNLEPAYCEVFWDAGDCPGYTWEWTRRAPSDGTHSFLDSAFAGPVRSYVSIYPTYLFYKLIKMIGCDSSWMVARGPLIVNALLVAAPTDVAVWLAARWLYMDSPNDGKKEHLAWWALYCSLSSWFNAYALIRTYSNSLETMIFALGLALISPEILGNKPNCTTRLSRSTLRAEMAFFLGGVGCAVRFSSLAAWVPMGIMLALQRKSPRTLGSVLQVLVGCCGLFGMLGFLATLPIDRFLYGFWAFPILGNFHFNVVEGNDELYGTHPIWWYVLVAVPVVAGFLVPLLVWNKFRGWSYGRRNLWILLVCYVTVHSFSRHKEFRFLLPMLPLFCLLSGKPLHTFAVRRRKGRVFIGFFVMLNVAVVLYLGLFHHRASIEVNRKILSLVRPEPQTYTIHYLMGCHSTPLLSHLHKPPIRFEPWALDCSPDCRASKQHKCESDELMSDPSRFMEEVYFKCDVFEEGTCVSDNRILYPDFLVAMSGDLPKIQSRIDSMGMKEVARYPHETNGVKLGQSMYFGNFKPNVFSWFPIIPGVMEVTVEEMVLFASRDI